MELKHIEKRINNLALPEIDNLLRDLIDGKYPESASIMADDAFKEWERPLTGGRCTMICTPAEYEIYLKETGNPDLREYDSAE